MLLKIWKYFIVEYVSGCNRCFRVVELSKGDLTVGVYKRLLVDPANTFKITDIKRIL